MSAETVEFVRSLVNVFPALEQMFEEHLEDNVGEVLPHLLVADVARSAVAAVAGSSAREPSATLDKELLARLLEFLDDSYRGGGPEVQELLAVSFLENLPRPDEPGSQIRGMVGPSMRDQLHVIG